MNSPGMNCPCALGIFLHVWGIFLNVLGIFLHILGIFLNVFDVSPEKDMKSFKAFQQTLTKLRCLKKKGMSKGLSCWPLTTVGDNWQAIGPDLTAPKSRILNLQNTKLELNNWT